MNAALLTPCFQGVDRQHFHYVMPATHSDFSPSGAVKARRLRYATRRVPLETVSGALRLQWQHLASRSIEGNAFLTPWFLLPAARQLAPDNRIDLLLVEAFDDNRPVMLTGLIALQSAPASASLPLPHLAAYRPIHAYSSGALVDVDHVEATLRCLLKSLRTEFPAQGALRLEFLRLDGPLHQATARLASGDGFKWYSTRRLTRAAVRPSFDRPASAAQLPPSRYLRRRLTRLETMAGPVRLEIRRGADITDAVIDRHLQLEQTGWKATSGGAMLNSPAHAEFFREISHAAARCGAAVYCELLAGDTVVASTSNFVCGREAFAFKLGWDPRFARCSPGYMIEELFSRALPVELPRLRVLDGCAEPGSYLERVWNEQVLLADGYLAWGLRERAMLSAIDMARRIRKRLRSTAPMA